MSYNKTTWATGDTITAEKLNKIEDTLAEHDSILSGGGTSDIFVIKCTTNEQGQTTLDETITPQDIFDAFDAGKLIIAQITLSDYGAELSDVVLEALCHGQIVEGEEQGETLRILLLESDAFSVQMPAELPVSVTNVPLMRFFGYVNPGVPEYSISLLPETSGDLTVTFTKSNGTVTCDTPFLNIKNAISSGKVVPGRYVHDSGNIYPLTMSLQSNNKIIGSYTDYNVVEEIGSETTVRIAINIKLDNYGTVTVKEHFPVQ